jgi:hypothetical protein
VAVAPGDVLGVLAAFPALRELKVDAVIAEGAVVGGAAAEVGGCAGTSTLALRLWNVGADKALHPAATGMHVLMT